MKTLIKIIVVTGVIFAGTTQAQIKKGTVLIGASTRTSLGLFGEPNSCTQIMNMGFSWLKFKSDSYESDEADKYTSLNISPEIGYFVAKNFVVGVDINLAFAKYSTGGEYESTERITYYAGGPFIRYYIPVGKFYTFLEGGATFGSQKYVYEYSGEYDDSEKMNVNCYGGGAGIAIPLGKKATFDTMLTYNSMTVKDKGDNPDNARTIEGTLGVKFGIRVFLGK